MKQINLIGFVIVVVSLVVGAYFLGQNNPVNKNQEPVSNQPKNLEEIAKLESSFDNRQKDLDNRVNEIQNQIETVKLNLGLNDLDTQARSQEIADHLKQLDDDILKMKTEGISEGVPIPPDSPSGRLISQPRTASGIPVSVLENYERETGVTAAEIEELMQRTQ